MAHGRTGAVQAQGVRLRGARRPGRLAAALAAAGASASAGAGAGAGAGASGSARAATGASSQQGPGVGFCAGSAAPVGLPGQRHGHGCPWGPGRGLGLAATSTGHYSPPEVVLAGRPRGARPGLRLGPGLHRAAAVRRRRTALAVGPVVLAGLVAPNAVLLLLLLRVWRGGRADITDGEAMQKSWASYAERPTARFMALLAGGIRFGAVALRAKFARSPERRSELNRAAGRRAVQELVTLGPTYVKLGQIVSCRQDLVPPEYVEEMKRLQDEVPAFSGSRAKAIMEKELGKPLDSLFRDFSEQPLAAASLGQVHTATTLEGKKVAIKIQRDKLKEMYDLDLAQFDKVTAMLDKFNVGVQGASQKWSEIFSEAKVILYRELDYLAEAENTIRIGKNFEKTPWIKIPAVLEGLTTEHVLTMEYCPGIKISDLEKLDATKGIDRQVLGAHLAQCYLQQFCKHGFFNTDPHPGNLAVDEASPGGRLIFYDFGQACELEPSQCDGILQVIQSIVDLDAPACVQAMGKLGVLKEGADEEKLRALIENNFRTGKVKSRRSRRKVEKSPEAETEADTVAVPKESETMKFLQLPAQLAFVARAITQLQGVGVMLDEDWEFIDLVAEKVPELQMERGAGLDYLAGQIFKNITR